MSRIGPSTAADVEIAFPRVNFGRAVLIAYGLLLLANGLAAYSIGPVPIQWVGMVGVIGLTFLIGLHVGFYPVPGTLALGLLLLWAAVVTVGATVLLRYDEMMPPLATSPYPVFVGLRFMTLLSFICIIYLVYWLLRRGYEDELLRVTVGVGTFVAVAAIYIYVAQMTGLPEPPRGRMGTAGGEQSVRFTYAFHRATGTFREPSHLAEWLIAPLFLSMVRRTHVLNAQSVAIGSALLLTGSLTGILGGILGFLGALTLGNPLRGRNLGMLFKFMLLLILAALVFRFVAVSYFPGGADLLAVIWDRLVPILFEGGMAQSNRDYIYDYLATKPLPVFGVGLGHAQLAMSAFFGSLVVVSFINLYASTLYSLGLVGLAILTWFLVKPVANALTRRRIHRDPLILGVLAGYLSWLVMFAVHSEEFSIMFGVSYALLVYRQKVNGLEEVPES